jgi:hypothetical protein
MRVRFPPNDDLQYKTILRDQKLEESLKIASIRPICLHVPLDGSTAGLEASEAVLAKGGGDETGRPEAMDRLGGGEEARQKEAMIRRTGGALDCFQEVRCVFTIELMG